MFYTEIFKLTASNKTKANAFQQLSSSCSDKDIGAFHQIHSNPCKFPNLSCKPGAKMKCCGNIQERSLRS